MTWALIIATTVNAVLAAWHCRQISRFHTAIVNAWWHAAQLRGGEVRMVADKDPYRGGPSQ